MKQNIKGKNLALYLEKPVGSGTFVRIMCADEVGLESTTEEIESTNCDSDDEDTGVSYKEYEAGDNSWTMNVSGGMRMITNDESGPGAADADTNISSENVLDLQLSQTKLLARVSLDLGTGAARYTGKVLITSFSGSGPRADKGTFSATLRGTGPLTKSLVP